jgi:8-oxo-dGTP diphosphatase
MNSMPATTRISAGGVVYKIENNAVEVALILVAPKGRWQLPKGTVDEQEADEAAALREVREETGLEAQLLKQIDRIEYWFYVPQGGKRVRFHKYVSFYLMRYLSGSVEDHDHEVEEARWIEINQAIKMLAFDSERDVLRKAAGMIQIE